MPGHGIAFRSTGEGWSHCRGTNPVGQDYHQLECDHTTHIKAQEPVYNLAIVLSRSGIFQGISFKSGIT